MSIAQRSAVTTWTGPLASGAGTVTAGSAALDDLAVTWASRTERPDGRTSPEELAAAAHSSCFAMALSLRLGEHRHPPQQLRVEAVPRVPAVRRRADRRRGPAGAELMSARREGRTGRWLT